MSLKASTITAPRATAPKALNSISFRSALDQVGCGDANEHREALGDRQNVLARRLAFLRCPPRSPSEHN